MMILKVAMATAMAVNIFENLENKGLSNPHKDFFKATRLEKVIIPQATTCRFSALMGACALIFLLSGSIEGFAPFALAGAIAFSTDN